MRCRTRPRTFARRPHRVRGRGLITVDAVTGLVIIAVLAGALVLALNRRQMAGDRLSDARGAAWAAESALVQMQAGGRPVAPDGSEVVVEALGGGDEAAPRGYVWVRVRGLRNGRSATLTGLVPQGVVPQAATAPPAATAPAPEGSAP
jgi:type II secretory pathway pseudopilin PulG